MRRVAGVGGSGEAMLFLGTAAPSQGQGVNAAKDVAAGSLAPRAGTPRRSSGRFLLEDFWFHLKKTPWLSSSCFQRKL